MRESEYPLPEDDIEFLNSTGYKWERVVEDTKRGLIIQGYSLPDGYVPDASDLMLLIPPDYPMGMIDTFYFYPEVSRKVGGSIDALSLEDHFGQRWQRWSRHYTWRPGIDSIATHVPYVTNQLEYELRDG